ncbi:MAG: HD domain-containing protein [Clostridia bacterium]|nr:HD domain-containing protein [Clostridia bacterium]
MYTAIVILTELMMIAMTLHVLNYSGFTKKQKTWYILTFISIMLCSAAEYAVHCGVYDPGFATVLTVLTVMQFSVAPVLTVLFAGALGLHNHEKIAGIYFIINLLVETVSAPFGFIFYFNEEGYSRGEYFIIYEAFYFLSFLYLIFSLIKVGKKFRHRDFLTIIMVVVLLAAGILPMTFYRLNITYMAIALCASLCYIYYNDLVQQDIKAELVNNQEKMTGMQEHIISGLANLIENRDTETGEHITRTQIYVKKLAEYAAEDGVYSETIDDRFISMLYALSPLHDIGKIVVSDVILKKPGKLSEAEFEQMKRHAAVGGKVVKEILNGISDEEYISFASDIAMYHHERWDGTGYPKGLSGENIPLPARIMAIADVFDALVSERCYKKPIPPEEAFEIIRNGAGTHFDPKLTEVFLNHKSEFEKELK